jgi:hypothetical protein
MRLQKAVFTLLLAAVPLATAAQGLGDAAAHEKQRRAKAGAKASGKVVTENDLDKYAAEKPKGSEPTGAAPATAAAPQDTAELPAVAMPPRKADSESGGEPDSDSSKRARAEEYKGMLAAAEAAVTEAERRLAAAEERWRFADSHSSSLSEVEPARGTLEAARGAAERARRYRDSIADAARREGIPPGWLR